MLKIGVTGGIGCGKTEVSKLLRSSGIPIIPADLIARKLINIDPWIRRKLTRAFGKNIYRPDGVLDRKMVSDIIFADSAAREKINAIVHPRVISVEHKILDKLARSGKFSAAGVEAALIYEAGSDRFFDVMLVVAASPATVLNRLKKRDGFNPDQMQQRIAAQMELDEKIRRADYVIDNSGNLDELTTKVRKFVEWLHQQFSLNINDSKRI